MRFAYLGQAQALPRIFKHTLYNRYPGAGGTTLESKILVKGCLCCANRFFFFGCFWRD